MGIWSIGYFASTVGTIDKVIQAYIEQKGKEDSGQAQLELACTSTGGSPQRYIKARTMYTHRFAFDSNPIKYRPSPGIHNG